MKKGMLLVSETLKLVIAVICIGFLGYLLSMMYFAEGNQQEEKDASTLKGRMENITLSLAEGNSSNFNGLTPSDWGIFSYTSEKPNQCAGESCICVCEDVVDVFNRQLGECSDNGFCFSVKDLLPNEEIIIEDGAATNIKIYRSGGRVGVIRI